jgi:hypothetical protein
VKEFERGMYFISGTKTLCEKEKFCRMVLLVFLEWMETYPNWNWEWAFTRLRENRSAQTFVGQKLGLRRYYITENEYEIKMEIPKILANGWEAYVQESKQIRRGQVTREKTASTSW